MTDQLSTALTAVRAAERRLVAGEIPRCQFDAVAGSHVAVIAEAAERYLWLRDEADFHCDEPGVIACDGLWIRGDKLDAAIDAAMKGGEA